MTSKRPVGEDGVSATAWCGCPGTEHVAGRDHYQERVDLGECAWCEKPYDRTVCFETCDHASPTCAEHFDEYFNDTEWMPEFYMEPMCPECYG